MLPESVVECNMGTIPLCHLADSSQPSSISPLGSTSASRSGSRKFAVTVYPRRSEGFQPGEYRCQVNVNDRVAWQLPIQIGE